MKRILYIVLLFVFVSCQKLDFERVDKISATDIQINDTWVTASSSLVDINKKGISSYGHCWSLSKNPTINDNHTTNTSTFQKSEFIDTLLLLQPEQTYYIRSYVNADNKIIYGEENTFVAPNSITIECKSVNVTRKDAVVTFSTIANLGSLQISEYGTLISKNIAELQNGEKRIKSATSIQDDFSETFTQLNEGECYFIQVYAKLSTTNTIYSNIIEVKMPKLVVVTGSYDVLGSQAVRLYATVESLSFDNVTSYGFCWSETTAQPNYNSSKITFEKTPTVGLYDAQITGLNSSQTYYYRSFAICNNVVVYGDIKTFKIK